MRNIDLHNNLGLEPIKKHLESTLEQYYDKAMPHDNHFIVAAADYAPESTHAEANYCQHPNIALRIYPIR